MNENQGQKGGRRPKRKFSLEERRGYCIAWEKSEMDQVAFCKASGVSKSALYKWNKEFKKEDNGLGFSPLILEKAAPIKQANIIQLNVYFPNQIQLSIAMPDHRLALFIQELGYATAVIR